jgi:hypothetical protein
LGRDRTAWSTKHPIYSAAIDEAMGDGALGVADDDDEVEVEAELVVTAKLEVDEDMAREDADDCEGEVDREEMTEVEDPADVEVEVDVAAEVVEVLDEIEDARLDVPEDEIDDVAGEVAADDDDVEDIDAETDDDTEVEPTAQTPILQLPPQIWLLSPPHLAEQSVSGTLALLETAFNSFAQ